MNKSLRILFLINGYGLGNATRCHAIIEEMLHSSNKNHLNVKIIASGKSYEYFKTNLKNIQLLSAKQLQAFPKEKKNQIFLKKIIVTIKNIYYLFWNHLFVLNEVLKFKPILVITDSFYIFFPLRFIPNTKVWSINNSSLVVQNRNILGPQYWSHFLRIELTDYIYHYLFSKKVFVPTLKINSNITKNNFNNKFVPTPLILRSGFIKKEQGQYQASKNRLLFLSSSSYQEKSLHLEFNRPELKITIVGSGMTPLLKSAHSTDKMVSKYSTEIYPSTLSDKKIVSLLKETVVAVSFAGTNTLSELYSLDIPTLILPIPGHSEQRINGFLFGKITSPKTFAIDLENLLKHLKNRNEDKICSRYEETGSNVISQLILDTLIDNSQFQ